MKDLNKFINSLLVAVSFFVAVIFTVGVLKKNSPEVQRTDQSSMGEVNSDEMTNKYIKEFQNKLKQDERELLKQIKKAQQAKPIGLPKDDDWRQVPIEQQISKDGGVERTAAGSTFGGTAITKDNAADFIATARKNGYHVVLSAAYEVISITPIMNTRNVDESFETNPAQ